MFLPQVREEHHEIVHLVWTLPDSIWAPRQHWADCNDFYDASDHIRRCVEGDWLLAQNDHNTAAFLFDAEKNADAATVASVGRVLSENAELILSVYDYYCSVAPPSGM